MLAITDTEGLLLAGFALCYVAVLAGHRWVFIDAWRFWWNFFFSDKPLD